MILWLLPLFVATVNACSCLPTYTLNNAMHTATSVVRVWVGWEMSSPHQNLRGTDDFLFDNSPRYYVAKVARWFKQGDDADLQTGTLIVRTERQSSMCGVTLPLKQRAILFGGAIRYEQVPGYAAEQPVLPLSGCTPQLTSFPLSKEDWDTLNNYQPVVCHIEDCGPTTGTWGNNGLETIMCGDNTTVISSTCEIEGDSYWQTCQWKSPDAKDCP